MSAARSQVRPKPARVASDDRRIQILEVAARLFAAQGFEGTTTRQIATNAKVNEAIIFRHFPCKDDLYWAVLEEWIGRSGGRAALEQRINSEGTDREILTSIAMEMLERRSRDTTLTRLFFFSALENHDLTERFYREHIAGYYDALAAFVRKRIEAGAFRRVDPLLAARGFLGMVVYHSWVQEVFGGKRHQEFAHKAVSEAMVDIWLAGMQRQKKTSPIVAIRETIRGTKTKAKSSKQQSNAVITAIPKKQISGRRRNTLPSA